MLTASGFIKEMNKHGIFDCLSYISGLSGGSWVLMDLIAQDFNVSSLLTNWKLDDGLLKGVPDFDIHQKDIVSGMNEDGEFLEKRMFTNKMDSERFFNDFEGSLQLAAISLRDQNAQRPLEKRGVGPLAKVIDFFLQKKDKEEKQEENKEFDQSLLFGSIQSLHQVIQFYIELHLDVRPKKMQGFTVSFTDYLGKAFKKRLSNLKDQSTSFSQLMMNSSKFQDFRAPIPLFIANCRNNDMKNVLFEFNPFEFGSWESNLKLFVKMQYLGSTIEAGKPSRCINGFDDIGFITATSSSIFNNVLIYIWQLTAQSSRETITAIKSIMSIFGLGGDKFDENLKPASLSNIDTDYAVYQPNPFYNYPGISNELTQNDYLYLVDGGEDGENIPLRPLTLPQRHLDIIFIIDSSSDEWNYPKGSKLKNVLNQLQKNEKRNYYSFPDFEKIDKYPIALGCNQQRLPIILYHPNAPYSYHSNTSTFKITYNESEVDGMLKNGGDIFSLGSNPRHINCVGCLMAKRRIEQFDGARMSNFCQKCFKDYCL